jgi:hypothetical protein
MLQNRNVMLVQPNFGLFWQLQKRSAGVVYADDMTLCVRTLRRPRIRVGVKRGCRG